MDRIQYLFGKLVDIFKVISLAAVFSIMFSCTGGMKKTGDDDSTVSLHKTYKDNFLIGVALSDEGLKDSLNIVLTKRHFNSITAENAMKWEFIYPYPDQYDFETADRFVEFGEANNMNIVGHVLVWHSQTPDWVFHDDKGNRVSRDTLLLRMRNHIHTVVGRYKGRVHCWDVVNEAIGDDGQERKNIWHEIIGIEYVQKAFEYAREADPDAILIYNDYSLPTPVKREGVVKLISDIQKAGVKVDVIGMQGHYHLDYPELDDLEESIVAFSQLGCKVHFTEMDINVLPKLEDYQGADVSLALMYSDEFNPWKTALPDSMQKILADRYVSFFEIFIRHRDKIDRVTLWGIQDGSSWLNFWPIRGRTNYPLLFDRNYQPKPAFWALMKLAENEEKKGK